MVIKMYKEKGKKTSTNGETAMNLEVGNNARTVPFLGEDDKNGDLIFKYCTKGNLDSMFNEIMENKTKVLPLQKRVRLLIAIAESLKVFHSKRVFHRDRFRRQNEWPVARETCTVHTVSPYTIICRNARLSVRLIIQNCVTFNNTAKLEKKDIIHSSKHLHSAAVTLECTSSQSF